MCWEIMLRNNDLSVEWISYICCNDFSFNSYYPGNLTYWTSFIFWIKILWTCSYCRVIGLLDTVPVLQYCREDVERLERRWTEAQGRRIRELRAEQRELKEELAAAKTRLLIPATRWSYERKWVIILTLLFSISFFYSVIIFKVRFKVVMLNTCNELFWAIAKFDQRCFMGLLPVCYQDQCLSWW